MIEVHEALERMLALVKPLSVTTLSLTDTLGCHAGCEVRATVPLPSFDNSSMDGYAVRAADARRGATLRVVGQQAAGDATDMLTALATGEAARIFTGAAIPLGTDAVVMQEDVLREGDRITVNDDVEPGQFIRRQGSDLCTGQLILRRGDTINAAAIGLLASQGRADLDVVSLPRAGVLTTGDELVGPGSELAPGQIFNSNGPMIEALLRECGVRDVVRLHSADDLTATTTALRQLMAECDAVIISGGVSVGERDLVKPALAALGAAPAFWRVRMKPGKPFLFAHSSAQGRRCAVFGLPGNPVSGYTTFKVLVRPILRRLMGAPAALREQTLQAELATDAKADGDRPQYLHGVVVEGRFHPLGLQRSDALFGLSQGTALLRVEPGETLAAGTRCTVLA